ncbi:MAG: T9SS type A sorting domain-containing protein [bacterium]|nr:T9SS type A sorting domain-containing protein [bacterium]
MRIVIALFSILLMINILHAQPTLEWTSPTVPSTGQAGWFYYTVDTWRFYTMDGTNLRVMSGPESSTPALTIPLQTGEYNAYSYIEVTGDGIYDIVIFKYVTVGSNIKFSLRIVDQTNGANVITFDNANYSYLLNTVLDIDHDGFTELVVERSPFPPASPDNFNFLVYQTNGTSVEQREIPTLPQQIGLANYPNPFNPATKITLTLSQPALSLTATIYDVSGRRIKQLMLGQRVAGTHEIGWDGTDENNLPVVSGTYFCQISEGTTTLQARMMQLVR